LEENVSFKVVALTDIPSPYQVQLFNALAEIDGWKLRVMYSRLSAPERLWTGTLLFHEHYFLTGTNRPEILQELCECDLAVFGGYRPANIGALIPLRNRTGKPWAFWGERPGFRFPGYFGRLYRAWALRHLRASGAPIWGIGRWAIEGYCSELGKDRLYFNVPYSSNLAPFHAIERHFGLQRRCRFLFSGSLTHRKGVDLLISAFDRLMASGIDCELHLVGTGPLEKSVNAKLSAFTDRIYMHGFRQWDELPALYAQADFLCAPSRYDGWGLVIVEGLAAGMPVISTDRTGAARELIKRSNGWLVPAGDEDALYSAMRSAAALDANGRHSMSECALQTSRTYDISGGVQRFVQAAERTMRNWRPRVGG
jgi:glycosyltransferase involved in cell wall biosynthesis